MVPLPTAPVPPVTPLITNPQKKTEKTSLPYSTIPQNQCSFYSRKWEHFKTLIIYSRNSCTNCKDSETVSESQISQALLYNKSWTSKIILHPRSHICTGSTHIQSTTNASYILLGKNKTWTYTILQWRKSWYLETHHKQWVWKINTGK